MKDGNENRIKNGGCGSKKKKKFMKELPKNKTICVLQLSKHLII